jgi:argininosuccinate lyase
MDPPPDYLGAEGRVGSGPSDSLVEAGYRLEINDADFLHRGLNLADLAHVLELTEAGVLPRGPAVSLCRELLEMFTTPSEEFPYDPLYGDAYNSRERVLEQKLGTEAGWLPTGRTRREAGRIAFRIALRTGLLDLHDAVASLTSSLARRAKELSGALWNDTTYLQPAQPSSFGHYLAGFAEEALRGLERIRRAHAWANTSPAGSGGVAGTSIPLDRHRLARRLGFDGPSAHTRDGMWSVDGLIDAVVAATQSALTSNRLAEDLEIFASPQFGYVSIAGSLTRASVLLPQKRNPYALAVIRGGAGTLIGRTTGIMATQRTPSARTDNWLYAYGEVIQSVGLATRLVGLTDEIVASMDVDVNALANSAGADFSTSADLAERMVLAFGVDYRTAYRILARAVAASDGDAENLSPADLIKAADDLGLELPKGAQTVSALAYDLPGLVAARDVLGGSPTRRVEEHCARVEGELALARDWSTTTRSKTMTAERRILDEASQLIGR